jgi:4-hydroxy-tetrahydrodipicolinate reductase
MSDKIRVVSYGLGVMGAGVIKALQEKQGFRLVGAVDVNPKLKGRDVGEALGLPARLGVAVDDDAPSLFKRVEADVVVHATGSDLRAVEPQLLHCLKAGLDVVSTCEELSYPWKRHPEVSQRLDAAAREGSAALVGTGINPGYLMDSLPLMLTAPCLRVDSIRVVRMMNSARRRIPFQTKVGSGLTPAEFRAKIDGKAITGHVGLTESMNLIADGLGWTLDRIVETPPEAVIAERETPSGVGPIAAGRVAGLKSLAQGFRGSEAVISLEFIAHAGVPEEYDEVRIKGLPDIHQRVLGGVHGDTGTIAMVINTVPRIAGAAPGLRTLLDLPLPRAVR